MPFFSVCLLWMIFSMMATGRLDGARHFGVLRGNERMVKRVLINLIEIDLFDKYVILSSILMPKMIQSISSLGLP